MKINVCIGSSCHLKGARQVVQRLQALIREHALEGKAELAGNFCMGKCQEGVCVMVEDTIYSVSPETVDAFFADTVLRKLTA